MAGTLPDTTRQHPADRLLLSRLAAVDDVPASDRISFHSVRPAALAADFSYAAHVPPAGRPAGRPARGISRSRFDAIELGTLPRGLHVLAHPTRQHHDPARRRTGSAVLRCAAILPNPEQGAS